MSIHAEYDRMIKDSAAKHLPMIDWRLWKSQVRQESQFNHLARSPAGAIGLTQFMPKTWDEWCTKAGFDGADPTDPEASVYTGACYMAYLWGQWASPRPAMDRLCLSMASYNAGLGSMLKAQKLAGMASDYKPISASLYAVTGDSNAHETRTYVRRILGYYAEEVAG